MVGFDSLNNRYVLECVVQAEGALHIGTGVAGTTSDAPFIRMGSDAFIPGSSLRGVLRSTVERLLDAIKPEGNFCRTFETVGSCDSSKTSEELELRRKDDLEFCAMCRLFGSTSLASRFKITDAEQIGTPIEPVRRDGVGIDRDTETARDQIKYDFETLEPGNDFRLTMQVENIEDEEKALLYAMLIEFQNGVDVGGKRSRGLGRVALRKDFTVRFFDPEKDYPLSTYLTAGKLGEMAADGFLTELKAAFLRYTAPRQGGLHVAARVA